MNDRKQIFAWAMYDWANSAYITTVAVGILPIYFADVVLGGNDAVFGGQSFSATTVWAWLVGFSALVIFLCAPVLGAISDFSASKKIFVTVFCYAGSMATILLVFCGPGDVWETMALFVIAQTCFVGGNVFYDAFLPQIASEDKLDRVSGRGFAYGYIGGGLQFAGSLALIAFHGTLGLSMETAVLVALGSAGVWWGGFALVTVILLRETGSAERLPERYKTLPATIAYVRIGIERTVATARKVRSFKHLLMFLIAFMIYNDGIQTVIALSTIYGRKALGLSMFDLMLTLLIIQFVAIFGALMFSRVAEKLSTKRALMITLLLWSGVVIYAYFMTTAREFYILGIIVGITMGGSQALSRSLYGSIIPVDASAEFYGFYSVFSKFSAIWGPFVFGVIDKIAGSPRLAIISLILFFIVGLALLALVNVEKAKKAKQTELFVN